MSLQNCRDAVTISGVVTVAKGMLRLVGIALASALGLAALSASASAKGADTWHIQSAFDRAQGLKLQNFSSRKKGYRRRALDGYSFFYNDSPRWRKLRKQRFWERKRRRQFVDIDPEPDYSIVKG